MEGAAAGNAGETEVLGDQVGQKPLLSSACGTHGHWERVRSSFTMSPELPGARSVRGPQGALPPPPWFLCNWRTLTFFPPESRLELSLSGVGFVSFLLFLSLLSVISTSALVYQVGHMEPQKEGFSVMG